jgi:hypothetical protein
MIATPAERADAHRLDIGSSGYVDWPSILAGTVLAVALSFVLLTFGSAIGLSLVSFEPREGASLLWLAIASGLWFLWVAITSFAAGGYLAGRLRRPAPGAAIDEIEVRDASHGLLVWATATFLGAVLAASGISGVIGAAGRATGTIAETASQAVEGDVGQIGARLMRTTDGGDAAVSGDRAAALIADSLGSGSLAAEDRDYLAGVIARQTGQTEDEAASQVDAAFARAQELYDNAIDAAEKARKAATIGAFLIAATLLGSAAAAAAAAAAGGDHRDRNLPFGKW